MTVKSTKYTRRNVDIRAQTWGITEFTKSYEKGSL